MRKSKNWKRLKKKSITSIKALQIQNKLIKCSNNKQKNLEDWRLKADLISFKVLFC